MNKVITAIGNEFINNKLLKENNIKVISKDIPYVEGVFEVIEKNQVDFLIINVEIINEINIDNFIRKIKKMNKKINLIFILEKTNKLIENKLIKNNIKFYFYNKKIKNTDLIDKIKNEINGIKKYSNKMIYNNNLKIRKKNNIKKEYKKINYENIYCFYSENSEKNKIIIINFINYLKKINYKKILIINLNIFLEIKNNSKKIIYKKSKKIFYHNFNVYLNKIDNTLDSISGLDFILKKEKNVNQKNRIITDIFLKELRKYDAIVVNADITNKLKISSVLLENIEKNILLIEPSLLGIRRGMEFIEENSINKLDNKQGLHIVMQNNNKKAINKKIIKECFKKFNVIGQTKNNKNNFNLYKKIVKNRTKNKALKILKERF